MAIHASGLNSALRNILVVSVATVSLLATETTARGFDPFAEYDLAMFDRPAFTQSGADKVFQDGLEELWLKALQRPDPELQRLVVDTLAHAHRRGLPGLEDNKAKLIAIANQPDARLDVLRAIAQTLVVLDASEYAEKLGELSLKHGLSIASIVEPALANWKSPVLQEAWLNRVSEASAGQTLISLAIEGLGSLETAEAAEPLEKLVRSSAQPTQLRVLAARHLGQIRSNGLVELAGELLEQDARHPELNAVVAIELLSQHTDVAAVQLVNGLASHPSTAVQSRALERLYAIDFKLVDRHADQLLTSPDANVRTWIARAMIDKQDADRVQMIASLLNDVNPTLRREATAGLVELGQREELSDDVIQHSMDVLNQDQWRGCEQACRVLAKLDHKPSGSRMVELLGHPRGEVKVASAWGLTQLRVPEHLPDMLDHAQSVHDGFKSGEITQFMSGAQMQMAHLFIAFGDQVHKPAEPLIRAYIPKNHSLGVHSRAAAAWAIGLFYVDDPQEDLARMLGQRIADVGIEGETEETRQTSAVSIGRMKAESALGVLKKFGTGGDYVSLACYWAIQRITGEEPPAIPKGRLPLDSWFLSPIPNAS